VGPWGGLQPMGPLLKKFEKKRRRKGKINLSYFKS
jgi:hypothetical protein